MRSFFKDIREIFDKMYHFLSLNDALITSEGRVFLNDPKKMESFYDKLKKEEKNVEERNINKGEEKK